MAAKAYEPSAPSRRPTMAVFTAGVSIHGFHAIASTALPGLLAKAAQRGADALIVDLEDAVPLEAPQPESLLWAAHVVTNCARAFGPACWGLPGSVAVIDDMDAFAALVKQGRGVGFSGTVCIHPRQVAVANAGFGPSDEELAWAHKVLAADDEARARGLGAVVLDGRMIDRPIVERARRWLEGSRPDSSQK